MAWYRMYFVDPLQRFRWPCDLPATDDADALALAHALRYSCSDVPVGVELWHGARRIPGADRRPVGALRAEWDAVASRKGETLLRVAEVLRNSGTPLARSRRLAEQLTLLQNQIAEKVQGASGNVPPPLVAVYARPSAERSASASAESAKGF